MRDRFWTGFWWGFGTAAATSTAAVLYAQLVLS